MSSLLETILEMDFACLVVGGNRPETAEIDLVSAEETDSLPELFEHVDSYHGMEGEAFAVSRNH